MRNLATAYFVVCAAVFLQGCSTVRKVGTVAATTAGGAAIGYAASGGNPLVAGAGAAGGLLAGGAINMMMDHEVVNAAEEAYVKGRSDAVKEHYWMLQAQEQRVADARHGTMHYYDVQLPAGVDGEGVRRVSSVVTIPIVE